MLKGKNELPKESMESLKGSDKHPVVSIIIPIRRGENIIQTLACIWDSTSNSSLYETIVVDEGKERSIQRNIGIKKAKGKYLLILDSDQLITRGLLEECVALMKDYDALYIPETIVGTDWFSRLRGFERKFYTSTPIDAVRFVRSSRCPYFDETMNGPEDSDWDRKVPGRRATTVCSIRHNDRSTPLEYLKKKAYYSKSMRQYAAKNPNDKVLSFKWRCWRVFIENEKYKMLLAKPHYAIGMFVMIFIRGLLYLWYR